MFGCLRCKPAFVSKYHDALWAAEWSGEKKSCNYISPRLRDEGTSPFSDLLGNSSCGSLARLSRHSANISCPEIVLLQLRKMNGNSKPHMRNIGKTSSSKPHSLTFPPSQFTHVWRIRSCDPNRSVSPEVSLSQLSGLNVRNSPHWTEFMIGMISVDQYDAISERHPVIRESPFNVFPSMQTSLWVNTRVKGTTGLVCISSSPICYKSYSWPLVSSVYTAPFSVFHVRLESPQIFGANSEGMKPVTNSFRPALRGRFFRIHPQTWHGLDISMRVELYTCASGQWVNFLHNQTNLLSQIFQFIIGRHQKGVGNWVRKVTLSTIMAVTECKGHSGSELFTCGCLHSQARTHHSDAACLDLSLLETTPRTSVVLSLAQSPSHFGDGKFQLCHQLVIIFTLILKAMLLLWFT